jgi:hypothetical protein
MNFKELEWEEGASSDRNAYAPFGLMLDVRQVRDKFFWELENGYYTIKNGSSVSQEKAMKNAEKAFHEYVEGNLAKC